MQVCRIQFGGGVSQEQDSADKPVWCHCTSDERSLWSGHTSRSVYNIHLYMLGLGVQVEILKALMVIIFASPPIFTPTLSI